MPHHQLTHSSRVLITGATGLIGGEILRRLVTMGVNRVWTLQRQQPDVPAVERIRTRLARSGDKLDADGAKRISPTEGDMTAANLGLAEDRFAEISESVDIILHSAAETSFIRHDDCSKTNIDGMKNLLAFASECSRPPLVIHLSTAYICGLANAARLTETDAWNVDDQHHNQYTRSKAEAETLLMESGLPHVIVRPSITLGAGLPDREFARSMTWFLPLSKYFECLPVDPDSRVDIVPVSYVADAIVELARTPRRTYTCYHITADREAATRCGDASQLLDHVLGRKQPLKLIKPHAWNRDVRAEYIRTPRQRQVYARMRPYLPFMNMNVVFDNTRLRRELGDRFPDLGTMISYLEDVI